MKHISSKYLKEIINEAVRNVMNEAGAPMPLGGAPKPLGGAPMPLGGAPKPLGGAPAPLGGANAAGKNVSLGQVQLPDSSSINDQLISSQTNCGPTKNGMRPKIVSAKYENFFETTDPNQTDQEVLKLKLDFILDVNRMRFINAINQNYPDILYAMQVDRGKSAGSGKKQGCDARVLIIIRPGKNGEFESAVPDIVDTLYSFKQSNRGPNKNPISYDPTFKDEFQQRLIDFVEKIVPEQEIEERNLEIAETWMDLLQKMKDPAVMQKLQTIKGAIYPTAVNSFNSKNDMSIHDVTGDNGYAAGHPLSLRNRIQVFLQDPNATFVTQEFVWRNKYNHEIIDKSRYILVTIPSKKNVTSADKDKGAVMAGFRGGNDEVKARVKQGVIKRGEGEDHAVRMNAQRSANDAGLFFYTVKMYDVANTRPIQGMESKFLPGDSQIHGLENNVIGIPNAAAKSAVQTTQASAPNIANNSNITDNDKIEIAKDSLVAIVKRDIQGGAPQETGDIQRDVVNYAYAYAKFAVLPSFPGISKDDTKEAFCQGFTAAVAIAIGVEDDQAANYLAKALANRGKDSTLRQLVAKWHADYLDLLQEIEIDMVKRMKKAGGPSALKKVVEEMDESAVNASGIIHPLSLEEFESLFGIENSSLYSEQDDEVGLDVLQESFFKFLDRMDGYDR